MLNLECSYAATYHPNIFILEAIDNNQDEIYNAASLYFGRMRVKRKCETDGAFLLYDVYCSIWNFRKD